MSVPVVLVLALVTFLPAAVVSWGVLFAIRRHAGRIGLVDQPGHRKVHAIPTPTGGGLGIWCGIVTTFAAGTVAVALAGRIPAIAARLPASLAVHLEGMWWRADDLWLILGAGTVLMLLGLADDIRGLPWQLRIGVEFAVAAACVLLLDIRLTAFIPSAAVTAALSVLWIVTLINSFNMLDNMDGLSGGVAAIIAAMLALAMLLTPDPQTAMPQALVAAVLLVLCGGLVGFLMHNRPPARIFMGDAGAYLVGFLMAIATLLATYAGHQGSRPHAVLVPLCAMAVPLYDLVTVIWLRWRGGGSPFRADRRHFSHRLVSLGLSQEQAVLTIYLVTATCGLAALVLGRVDVLGAVMVLGIVACMMGLIAILESTGWRENETEQ